MKCKHAFQAVASQYKDSYGNKKYYSYPDYFGCILCGVIKKREFSEI